MRTAVTVGTAVLACVGVSGCTVNIGSHNPSSTPTVSKTELQNDISRSLHRRRPNTTIGELS